MADILKFTTWPKHQYVFHKITSDALVFDIKGEENAAIGLAKEPGSECELWVLIGHREQCWIKKSYEKCSRVYIPDVLTRNNYNKFWITLRKKRIFLGRNNESMPILTFHNQKRNLYYVTFTVLGERQHLKWKCYLPPRIENPPLKRITGGEPHWVKVDKNIPDNAFIGGFENEILYITRAHHEGSLFPGKLVPNLGLGFLSFSGDVFEKDDFEVLCGYDYTWMKMDKNRIPLGAIPGGYYKDGHEIVYVGRGYCDTLVIPGKIHASRDGCYIAYEGNEVLCQIYEILVTPYVNRQSVNNFYYTGVDISHDIMFNRYDNDESDEDYEGAESMYTL
ncbi:uncharacterized protein LOC124529640 [Vanessa cardui]|uniref:uncharacterized protein LOC124529640 n=1 Tax=Vanessa cardui TaxID=171605 RepID=UPI001F138F6D|nr:uncharacterized protein LOC124529640 [Vanessa cardui]